MELNNFKLKEKIDNLYNQLRQSAATFIYNPKEIEQIRQSIFELQKNCLHEYKNGKCIYCRKEQENVDQKKRYL